MMKDKWIWFDMDGTIADLYGVDGWLEDLIAHNTRPYAQAKDIYNVLDLLEIMIVLKENGYKLGVISWGSKENNKEYDKAVEIVKKAWLYDRLMDSFLDEIIVTPYGVRKADTCRKFGYGILVDDEKQNRDTWDLGITIDATQNIIKALWELVK